jgi:phage FluMu gp28-like protein
MIILPSIPIDSSATLAKYFMRHQSIWIQADDFMHAQGKQAFALAEKSVRIGWTFADAFKNVRKRLHHKKRDYLFATKDYPSALEYIQLAHSAAQFLDFTRAIVSHGEDFLKVNRLDPEGNPTSATEEIKIGYIKFDNGSRIIAFSSNPYAMAVYGGDVGLDEFAKHPNAQLLWQTAQARVTWGYDLAVWSSHDGEDTLFNQFVQQARAGKDAFHRVSNSSSPIEIQNSEFKNSLNPWNLYYRVTIADAVELGLLDVINRTQETSLTPERFLADCRARAGSEEIFQQSYMCNPLGAASAAIVEWSAIERCRFDCEIERVHLEHSDIIQQFGEFNPSRQDTRRLEIEQFLRKHFAQLLQSRGQHRLGFDVAASGEGDLAVFYIDEPKGADLWLRALLTIRTEDWDFLRTILFFFLQRLSNIQAAGDETGLGRQICWEAAKHFSSRFLSVNFASKKHDLGFALMNQLSVAEKRFPKSEQDIAADYFALRKTFTGNKWAFSEGRNTYNPVSHCDIAWAGALATHAHTERKCSVGGALLMEDGTVWHSDSNRSPQDHLLWSDDPRIWRRVL